MLNRLMVRGGERTDIVMERIIKEAENNVNKK
jgi:hypothetical protein